MSESGENSVNKDCTRESYRDCVELVGLIVCAEDGFDPQF